MNLQLILLNEIQKP